VESNKLFSHHAFVALCRCPCFCRDACMHACMHAYYVGVVLLLLSRLFSMLWELHRRQEGSAKASYKEKRKEIIRSTGTRNNGNKDTSRAACAHLAMPFGESNGDHEPTCTPHPHSSFCFLSSSLFATKASCRIHSIYNRQSLSSYQQHHLYQKTLSRQHQHQHQP
jgi:hypothetical protein